MSGHSRWATIKRKKGSADAKRGKLFTKIIKEITIAARLGGGDANGNPRLRTAIDKAKSASMPKDNIDRAIKKGTGELEGVNYEELVYECYGPGGIALIVEVMTDNKNRTVGEIRHILSRNNGRMGESGSVSWNFEKKGVITIEKSKISEEKILELALDAGADDVKTEDEVAFEITTAPGDFYDVQKKLSDNQLSFESAEIQMIPKDTLEVTGKDAEQIMKLIEILEDHDDVQNVYTNFEPPAEMV